MQALEAIKLLCGLGEPLIGRLLHVDALGMKFRTFTLRRDEQCPVCGPNPTITEPIDYQGFCGLASAHHSMPEPTLSTVTVHELSAMRISAEPHFLLDVREPYEAAVACIEGSVLIPLGELPQRLGELPRDLKLVVHCKSGGRSAKACALLAAHGFADVWNVAGGINAWAKEIDLSVAAY